MLKNYFKSAFRNLTKNKFYASINIIGLAVGIATCLLILLYVVNELCYDKYNEKANRIYRVDNELRFGNNHFDLAVAPALLGPTMIREVPQVEQYTRIRWYGNFLVRKGNANLNEQKVAFADSTLFDVFTLPMIAGDQKTALREPHSLVLTESMAKKIFNSTDIIGKVLLINDTGNYKITGVIKDIPAQSHFSFNYFISTAESPDSRDDNWLSENWTTYIVLKKNASLKEVNSELTAMMDHHVGPELQGVTHLTLDQFKKGGGFIRGSLMPLSDIHLHSNKTGELEANGNIQFVYIFSAIALFILIIACVNFMNLSTARSSNRAKEVGVRKVLGSRKMDLILQFLSESVLMAFIALIIAIGITAVMLPSFNYLAGTTIELKSLFHPSMVLSLLSVVFFVGLLAGSYPAFFLSSFRPAEVLKGKIVTGFKRSWLRNGLVVFQFFISIILMIGTAVIYNQLRYMRTKDIGFDRTQVLVINNTDALGDRAVTFRNDLLQISDIQNATISGYLPTNYNRSSDAFFTATDLDPKSAVSMQKWAVDENYVPTLGMKLVQGRNFSSQFLTDSSAIVINEAAANFLGGKNILNKKIYNVTDITTKKLIEYHIVGVVKNFNFSSLREVVTPLALVFKKDNSNISVRLSSAAIPSILAQIRNKWQKMAPDQPFEYEFMDEQFNNLYTVEQKIGQIIIAFTALAIVIACLGLLGLVTFAAEQRTKEIGVRKILGANVAGIVAMVVREFVKLVLVASVIAFPFAWWAMNKWLQGFAYRISISWRVFVFAGSAAILIALITVSFHAVKAAIANPVKSLRTE